ncbi:MAG TPA: copper resistance system multicopper oxidase [Gammaproteobacteria bacterium]|nr:copper resistance system multicopper oxidase [Gammaproteobacteria bacterium]
MFSVSRKAPLGAPLTLFAALILAVGMQPASARTYDLTIARTPINITGTPTTAVTVNGVLPGPTLNWHEGEHVIIHVTNKLKVPTSIHWHGILLPADMDGVPGISFMGIAPGMTFTYRFTVKQAGTYWYHSHSGGQEQEGFYGAIEITPQELPPFHYQRDYAVVLSDWSDESPGQIMANLKSQPDYYNYAQRTVPEFFHDIAAKGLGATLSDRLTWGRMRMSPTDLSDVTGATYTYLMNGKTDAQNWTALYTPGQRVRLRLINASSMTYFDVRVPGLQMTVVQVDGQDVKPVTVDELRMAIAETYDVIVTPKDGRAYTIFVQSMDRSGYARGTLAPHAGMVAAVPPMDPRPLLTMRDMGMNMSGMQGMDNMPGMKMERREAEPTASQPAIEDMPMPEHAMSMKSTNTTPPAQVSHAPHSNLPAAAGSKEKRPASDMSEMAGMMHAMTLPAASATAATPAYAPPVYPGVGVAHIAEAPMSRLDDPGNGLRGNGRVDLAYADLESLKPHPDPAPDRTIVLHLTGNMERYMWSFNGKKYAESVPLKMHFGERVRIVMINDTMMNHPIHLHGMFMELQNDHGVHNPLLHTVNVQPGETLSVLVTADAPGGWALHCHLLYHMEAGMFREVLVMPPPGATDPAVYSTPAFADARGHTTGVPSPPQERFTMADTKLHRQVLLDQLEYQSGLGASSDARAWDAQAWFGGDYRKLWLKTEGTRSGGHTEDANLSTFYDRAFSPYFDFQAGVRHDFGGGPARNWAAFGIQGLAPYFFDVELTGYLGPGGRTAARAKLRYELLFTQRLILEPELEANFYGRDDAARQIGSGLSDVSLGFRLRYEFSRKFAPYLGIVWRERFGKTADFVRARGERPDDRQWVAGLRVWF